MIQDEKFSRESVFFDNIDFTFYYSWAVINNLFEFPR